MSTTLSTQAMVTELQFRLPIGANSTTCMFYLNAAFRWIETKGSFQWSFKLASPALQIGSSQNTVSLPTDFDPSKLAAIYCNNLLIKYLPMDEFVLSRGSQTATAATGGVFGGWSMYGATGSMTAIFGPDSAKTASVTTLETYYHALPAPLTVGSGTYFPTPDELDDLIVGLAESEIRRIYELSGWEKIRQQSETAALEAIDKCRTTTITLTGLADASRRRDEKAAEKSRQARD